MMRHTRLQAVATVFVCHICFAAGDPWKQPNGLVPDKETATKIAEAVLFSFYGEDTIKSERPYVIDLQNGIWRIRGSMPRHSPGELWAGGTFYIAISQWDARIIEIGHEL